MQHKNEHIVIMLVKELIEQYSRCADDAYYGGKSLVRYSLNDDNELIPLIYNPFFEWYIKKLQLIKEYDLVYKDFKISSLYDVLESCGISVEAFNNVMYSIILNSIKSSMETFNEWSQFACFEQHLKPTKLEIIEEVQDLTPSYYVAARGEIDNKPLEGILNDYAFNDLELKIKTSEEIFKYMHPTINEHNCYDGVYLYTSNFINSLKEYKEENKDKVKKL